MIRRCSADLEAGARPAGKCKQQLVRLLTSVFFESIITATSSERTLVMLEATNSFPSLLREAMDYI